MQKISLSYILNGVEHTIYEPDENLRWKKKVLLDKADEQEYFLEIENCSGAELFLKHAILWEVSGQADLRVGAGPLEVYRSGRHKNDMPGTFTMGNCDERMKAVLGAMTEAGDKTDAEEEAPSDCFAGG